MASASVPTRQGLRDATAYDRHRRLRQDRKGPARRSDPRQPALLAAFDCRPRGGHRAAAALPEPRAHAGGGRRAASRRDLHAAASALRRGAPRTATRQARAAREAARRDAGRARGAARRRGKLRRHAVLRLALAVRAGRAAWRASGLPRAPCGTCASSGAKTCGSGIPISAGCGSPVVSAFSTPASMRSRSQRRSCRTACCCAMRC